MDSVPDERSPDGQGGADADYNKQRRMGLDEKGAGTGSGNGAPAIHYEIPAADQAEESECDSGNQTEAIP